MSENFVGVSLSGGSWTLVYYHVPIISVIAQNTIGNNDSLTEEVTNMTIEMMREKKLQ